MIEKSPLGNISKIVTMATQEMGESLAKAKNGIINLIMLAATLPQEQKQMLGEHLFLLIQKQGLGQIAGKITGMMLEKDNSQILKMIENSEDLTREVQAAVNLLIKHK